MSSNLAPVRPTPAAGVPGRALGPLGRLGVWTASHARIVVALWALTVIALGLFAPRVEQALAGAGWEASGSESVVARQIVQREFAGMTSSALQVVVHSRTTALIDPGNQTGQRSPGGSALIAEVTRLLEADPRVSAVVAPQAGVSISRDGRTVVIQAGAATADTNEMVRAADDLKDPLRALSDRDTTVALTGSSALWSDFNAANLNAMLKSEVISWPITLIILVIAFGSLVAAGLPLMLTIV